PEQVMQHLLLDIVNGLEALHECNIIHGDIKPDNVLIFPQENAPYFVIAKLSDFGLSVNDLGSSGDLVYQLGTLGWMAPELDDGVELATDRLSKCDFFSLGLLIWSVAT
ncbi:kinase-like domain-containing protein, partial [Tirmania nivea]